MQRDLRSFWAIQGKHKTTEKEKSRNADEPTHDKREKKAGKRKIDMKAPKAKRSKPDRQVDHKTPMDKLKPNDDDDTFVSPTIMTSQELQQEKETIVEAKKHTKVKNAKTKKAKVESTVEIVKKQVVAPQQIEPQPKPSPKKWQGNWNRSTNALAHGTKQIPEGNQNCLAGKVFCVTGVLESLDRDEVYALVDKYGGTYVKSLAKKTTHLIVGSDAGAKVEKAKQQKVAIINEDDFINLIGTLPAHANADKKPAKHTNIKQDYVPKDIPTQPKASISDNQSNELFVDSFRPQKMSQIVGNQDNVKKLATFLKQWKSGDNKGFKAALISGPPGIGKTTMAHVVSKELGFNVLEFNASDCRSKLTLKEKIAEVTKSLTIDSFSTSSSSSSQPSVLVMDEVDGMSTGDRGGFPELCSIIKTTKIPIICICNDRTFTSVKNLFLDIRLKKLLPGTLAIHLTHIATTVFSKHKDIQQTLPRQVADSIAQSADGDIRQAVHELQMWVIGQKTEGDKKTDDVLVARKDATYTPFDAFQRMFVKTTPINEKIRLYYSDSRFVPLLMQENYPRAVKNTNDSIRQLCSAAETISQSDIIETAIHKHNNWELSNCHALLSTIVPLSEIQGQISGSFQRFPLFLGKVSSTTKHHKLCRSLQTAMRTVSTIDKRGLILDAIPLLHSRLCSPLTKVTNKSDENAKTQKELNAKLVDQVITFMDTYNLSRDDWTTVNLLFQYGNNEKLTELSTYAQSTFTREFNTRHTLVSSTKRVRTSAVASKTELPETNEEENEEDQEDVNSSLIVDNKKTTKKTKRKL